MTAHRTLFHGLAPLAIANLAQRGLSFVANAAAARVGGAAVFGEYQLCLVTITTIASYAGLGIGNTTLRFGVLAGRRTWSVLFRWAILSASAAAAVVALIGIAGFLGGQLVISQLLLFGALSAFAIVFYEFTWARLIARSEHRGLVGLAVVTGIGLVAGLAFASARGAVLMILTHGTWMLFACLLILAIQRRYEARPPDGGDGARPIAGMLRFGAAQVATTAGVALASWWVFLQIAWHDTSHIAVGTFAVALQVRALSTLAPSLIAQQVLPRLAGHVDDRARMRACWNFSMLLGSLALCFSSLVLMALPLILKVYGPEYAEALPASAFLIACSIVVAANVGPFMYLTHSAMRTAAMISLAASAILAIIATLLVPRYGATGGAVAWLCAEGWSSVACLFVIGLRGGAGRAAFLWVSTVYAVVALLVGSSLWRSMSPQTAAPNVVLTSLTAVAFAGLLWKLRTRSAE